MTTTSSEEVRELSAQRALVTGGTRGIGASIVQHLLDAGAEVVATARNPADDLPAGARFLPADVGTTAGVAALAADVHELVGGVDILVHNAGGAAPHPGALSIPDEQWWEALSLNLLASVRLDALLAPDMQTRGSGSIVHISSAATHVPTPSFLHYTAAKAALENYSRGLAVDLAPSGVRVNLVTPGRTDTPGGRRTRERWSELSGDPTSDAAAVPPLGRDGRPEDVAQAVLFMASGRAGWITGSNLVVAGGEYVHG